MTIKRSTPLPAPKQSAAAILEDRFGLVKPYTRHTKSCPHRDQPDYNRCRCPKWLYKRRKTDKVGTRVSLNTPSWAEALEIAAKEHEKFHPAEQQLAALAEKSKRKEKNRKTIREATALFVARTDRMFPGHKASYTNAKTQMQQFETWALLGPGLRNLRNRKEWERPTDWEPILFIEDVTAAQLEQWYGSPEWVKGYSQNTRSSRWATVRCFFRYLHSINVLDRNTVDSVKKVKADDEVQGPYSEEQITALEAVRALPVSENISAEEKPVFNQRVTGFIDLLLNTGCDVGDAVFFRKSAITVSIDKQRENRHSYVFRYKRRKTGQWATIPLDQAIAESLLAIPAISENLSPDAPFSRSAKIEAQCRTWKLRVYARMAAAGIEAAEWETEDGIRSKERNLKQFRHTFAKRMLEDGYSLQTVAKMLGHKRIATLETFYRRWVKPLDDAHVREVEDHRERNRGIAIVAARRSQVSASK
jgi:integrase